MVAEHARKEHHPIRWQDRQGQQIWRIEGEGVTLHPSTPEDQRFNQDVGLQLPGSRSRLCA